MAQTTGQRYRVAPVRSRGREWPFPLNLYQSAVGRKWVMAVTGLGLIAFVLAHMVGNLHVYEGPARMHEYAESLRTLGGGLVPQGAILWLLRLGLLGMFVLPLHSAITLRRISGKASAKGRPDQRRQNVRGWSGPRGRHVRQPDHALDRTDHRPVRSLPPS